MKQRRSVVVVFCVLLLTLNAGVMEQVVTVFFQGNQASRLQATKYAGKEGLDIYVTNDNVEHVYNPSSPQLLYNLFSYPELNDVRYGWSWNPYHWLFMLLHWIRQLQFNIYGSACVPHNLHSRVNIAGSEDVAQCVLAIKACITKHAMKRIVLFGTSRGASTVLLALTRLSKEELSHIALVIAEAPFASVQSVLYATMPLPTKTVPFFTAALEYFTQYRATQRSPLQAVLSEDFPLDLPLVFVTSEVDTTVPVSETKQLLTVLQERKHTALHHIALKHSHHSWMSLHHEEDVALYVKELHLLYRKYL